MPRGIPQNPRARGLDWLDLTRIIFSEEVPVASGPYSWARQSSIISPSSEFRQVTSTLATWEHGSATVCGPSCWLALDQWSRTCSTRRHPLEPGENVEIAGEAIDFGAFSNKNRGSVVETYVTGIVDWVEQGLGLFGIRRVMWRSIMDTSDSRRRVSDLLLGTNRTHELPPRVRHILYPEVELPILPPLPATPVQRVLPPSDRSQGNSQVPRSIAPPPEHAHGNSHETRHRDLPRDTAARATPPEDVADHILASEIQPQSRRGNTASMAHILTPPPPLRSEPPRIGEAGENITGVGARPKSRTELAPRTQTIITQLTVHPAYDLVERHSKRLVVYHSISIFACSAWRTKRRHRHSSSRFEPWPCWKTRRARSHHHHRRCGHVTHETPLSSPKRWSTTRNRADIHLTARATLTTKLP